ncbi:MAG: hypothetical protein LBK40_05170 [Spirochaetaceae bacterium]|nr:hypothetical protein [Spirochaetaceae bacterium]
MSDNANPYESPRSNLNAPSPVTGSGGITETMVKYLKDASPWIRFLAIMGFIGSGFLFLAGIIFLILSVTVPTVIRGSFTAGGTFGNAPPVAIALFYMIVALLMVIPSRFLYGFGSQIRNYVQSGAEGELERALKSNRSFWKFCGVMTIVYLAAIPVLTIVLAGIAIGSRLP